MAVAGVVAAAAPKSEVEQHHERAHCGGAGAADAAAARARPSRKSRRENPDPLASPTTTRRSGALEGVAALGAVGGTARTRPPPAHAAPTEALSRSRTTTSHDEEPAARASGPPARTPTDCRRLAWAAAWEPGPGPGPAPTADSARRNPDGPARNGPAAAAAAAAATAAPCSAATTTPPPTRTKPHHP